MVGYTISTSSPYSQQGAVLTMEAAILMFIGVVMAISYGIILYDAITAWAIDLLAILKEMFMKVSADHLFLTCFAIEAYEYKGNITVAGLSIGGPVIQCLGLALGDNPGFAGTPVAGQFILQIPNVED